MIHLFASSAVEHGLPVRRTAMQSTALLSFALFTHAKIVWSFSALSTGEPRRLSYAKNRTAMQTQAKILFVRCQAYRSEALLRTALRTYARRRELLSLALRTLVPHSIPKIFCSFVLRTAAPSPAMLCPSPLCIARPSKDFLIHFLCFAMHRVALQG